MTTTSAITTESLAKVHSIVTTLYSIGCYAKMPETGERIALESLLEAVDDTLSNDGPSTGSYFSWSDRQCGKFDSLYIGKDGEIRECNRRDIW